MTCVGEGVKGLRLAKMAGKADDVGDSLKMLGKADDVTDGAKALGKGGGDAAKIDFYVTPAGDAIPANKVQFENNLSMMDNVNGKYLGETTNGPVRVRIEGPHPLDENFNGDWDSDHFIDHIHIEHRRNGNTGPWGKGRNNKITIPYSWIDGEN